MARGRPPKSGGASDEQPAPRRGLTAGVQPTRRLESRQEAFVRLLNSRMPIVEKAIYGIRQLSNPEIYDYSDRQIEAVAAHLERLVDSVKEAFGNRGKASTFKLEVDTDAFNGA